MRIIKAWQHISPDVTSKFLIQFCLSNAVDATDNDMLWNGIEEDGKVGGIVTKMKMETVTLIGEGR
jgi:hypothetical protein